ncbi:MAG: hypothetical protein GX220_09585 [Treponema sp.]|jgi:hypothetical protein|nr:hypothetical protein [Treponema sp.]
MFVGKIIVNAELDKEFIFKTFGMNEKMKEKNDSIGFPSTLSSQDNNNTNIRRIFDNGSMFFVNYAKPKEKEINLYKIHYHFFSHDYAAIALPILKNIKVLDDDQFLYIGTFKIHVQGNDYVVKEVTHYDEFDEAKAEFAKHFPKEELKRVVINTIE